MHHFTEKLVISLFRKPSCALHLIFHQSRIYKHFLDSRAFNGMSAQWKIIFTKLKFTRIF